MNEFAETVVEFIDYRIIGVSGIVTALIFLAVKIYRTGKRVKFEIGEVVRSGISIFMIFSGVQIFFVFLISKPPIFEKLASEDILLIGVVSSIVCVFIGCTELYTMLFVATGKGADDSSSEE